jgi:Acyltransferase family.
MLVFAVLKKLPNVKARAVFTVIIAAAAICTNIIFPKGTLATDNEWFNTMVTGLFTRQNAVSYFPFVSWFAFPIVGYWTAYFYRNIKDKKKFYIIVAAAAVALFAVGQGVITAKGLDPAALNPALANEDTYYGLDVWNIMSGTGLVLAELLLCFGILKLTQNRLPNFMLVMSKNIMLIYIIQWIIIAFLYKPFTMLPSVWLNTLIATGVLIASYWIAIILNKMLHKSSL